MKQKLQWWLSLGLALHLMPSQLMNCLISDKHDTFFHRHCLGSSKNRVLLDGVVDITWYCPSGEETGHFPNDQAHLLIFSVTKDKPQRFPFHLNRLAVLATFVYSESKCQIQAMQYCLTKH